MDSTVSRYLNKGPVDPTNKSHRTAAKTFHTFLLNQVLSKRPNTIELSPKQYNDHRDWNPSDMPHLPPPSLVQDLLFTRFLIHTMKQIEKKIFGKPTLRARNGWIT